MTQSALARRVFLCTALALPATAYDLPAGHSLTLVIDTVDPLYYDENAPNKSVTIGGGSYVDVPLR